MSIYKFYTEPFDNTKPPPPPPNKEYDSTRHKETKDSKRRMEEWIMRRAQYKPVRKRR